MNMLRITNTTGQEIELQTRHVIPARGFLDVETRVVDKAEADPWAASLFRRGSLVLAEVPGARAPEPITRASVAGMKKGELKEYLAMHGADTDGTADEMRDRLTEVMFIDL